MIDTICNRTYTFTAFCWKIRRSISRFLNVKGRCDFLRICSAGDIVLDYAIEGPAKIVVCMNQHQLCCLNSRLACSDPDLTYDEWWAI
jgi:hypothetical protein